MKRKVHERSCAGVRTPAQGVALIAVLWMTAALALLSAAVAAVVKADVGAAGLARDQVRAAALGDAVIHLGIRDYKFSERSETGIFRAHYVFDDVEVDFELLPGGGFLNINRAEVPVLAAVFEHSGGLSSTEAEALAEDVVAWRTPESGQALGGSARQDYIAAGVPFRPRHEPFETVSDLMQVLGMSRDLYDKIAPLVTVHDTGGGAGVNALAAPAGLLMALSKGNSQAVDAFLAQKERDGGLADTSPFEQAWLSSGGEQIHYASASVMLNGKRYKRIRWVDINRAGFAGEPWATVEVQSVRVESNGDA